MLHLLLPEFSSNLLSACPYLANLFYVSTTQTQTEKKNHVLIQFLNSKFTMQLPKIWICEVSIKPN